MVITHAPSAGEPAPWFARPDIGAFDEMAGRYIVLFFFGTAGRSDVATALAEFERRSDLFDGEHAAFLGISNDPDDRDLGRVGQTRPGQRYLWDFDVVLTGLYGVAERGAAGAVPAAIRPTAFVISPILQIIEVLPLGEPAALVRRVTALLREASAMGPDRPAEANAPVLLVPQIFDPALCRELIGLHGTTAGREGGITVERDGKAVFHVDHSFKRRFDCEITDEAARHRIGELIGRRLAPMVDRAFQFRATRLERFLIGCYDAATGGYFRPHRDNTTRSTAHRRFALTVNLNAEDYEGGDLRFPEFGQRTYRAPTGGAIVFSCGLLHEAMPVTQGRRYAFLPFLYDEAAEQVRVANQKLVV
jgi:predicted 2-oxoglutarate/Fe(II)-dependent dioxygenase YbiX/peroxiredoxin